MPRYDTEYIGENIKAIRKKNKLSQKQLANLVGVSQAAIYYYESGKRDINMEMLSKMAKVLNVSISDFFIKDSKGNSRIDLQIFASSKEKYSQKELDLFCGTGGIDFCFPEKINDNLTELNEQGQAKLYNYSCDLLKIPEYRADTAPDQGETSANRSTPKQNKQPYKDIQTNQNSTAPDELMAAHQRTDIEPTKEGIQHDLDIMNDASTWE